MLVVIDTNVFISALFYKDKWSLQVLEKEYLGEIKFAMNQEMYEELNLVFLLHIIKLGIKGKKLYKLNSKLIRIAWRIHRSIHKIHTEYCKDDPDDNKFIDCALDSKCNYLITENGEHLFKLQDQINKDYKTNIKILSPYQFIVEFNAIKLQKKYNKDGA